MFNPNSEKNLISICLKNPDRIIDVESADIYADHFGVPGHRHIFMSMMYLYSKQIKPTPMAILEVLSNADAKESINELGGLEYLSVLEEIEIPADNLGIFIEKVKQSYTRRKLLNIGDELTSFIKSEKAEVLNPNELVSFIESKINDLTVNMSSTSEVYKMGDNTDAVLEERGKNPEQIPGLETGWEEFDYLTNGGGAGDLIVVVAPSKTGKSVTLTNWATNIGIRDKLPVLYFDTEMNEREQEDRILANLSGVPEKEIISGLYMQDTVNGRSTDKLARIKEARDALKMGNYYHIYLPHFSIEKITAIAKKFMAQVGLEAIFFDYIKIPSSSADFKSQQEYQALGFFTSGLKDLAGTLKMPIFSACQTNRNDLATNDPDASDIGGSYRILQLASKLIFLINKSDERIAKEGIGRGNQQLIIKYQRKGESDCPPINIMFDKAILRQSEC